jgi:Ca2+/Na+ antiporter
VQYKLLYYFYCRLVESLISNKTLSQLYFCIAVMISFVFCFTAGFIIGFSEFFQQEYPELINSAVCLLFLYVLGNLLILNVGRAKSDDEERNRQEKESVKTKLLTLLLTIPPLPFVGILMFAVVMSLFIVVIIRGSMNNLKAYLYRKLQGMGCSN